ncbi:LysR family transcriptional regulator [Guyparkeria sp.]|uniref:LysR family transcriptional regulator n=1 Tax=Guyparkeria sp. TaxID=2035736 RepID=UPI0035663931
MNPAQLDTQQLLTFLAVAESGSFSGAAARLHVSQPAVSKRIALLEQRLGFSLFDRMGQRVVLTYPGEQLLPAVQDVQRSLDDIATVAAAGGGATGGRLSLALSHYCGLHLLPAALERFSTRYPEVLLDLSFHDSERAIEAVRAGEAALAYATLPPRVADGVQTQAFREETLVPMIARRHHTGSAQDDIRRHGERLPLILPARATSTRAAIDRWLDDCGLMPPAVIEINQLDSIAVLAGTGVGWALLPTTLQREGLVCLECNDCVLPTRRLGRIEPVGRARNPLAEAFMAVVEELDDA